jgi:Fur family ferric uptake transcriptional regulator
MPSDGAPPLERFRRYLGDQELPATPQRLAVAEAVCQAAGHVSVEDVAERVRERGVAVGTATIYRTLDLLVRSGLVRAYDFGEGFRRFALAERGGPWGRYVCTSCGRTDEFSNDRLERVIGLLAEEVAFRPHHHRLEVYGLCRACQQEHPLTHAR